MSCTERFIAGLRERGLRLTPQREMVLDALHELGGHESAEGIYRRVHERSAAVDRSTVYRTLELLQEMGLLSVTQGAEGQRRYSLTAQHGAHIHLVCRRCGGEIEADEEPLDCLARTLHEAYGFILDLTARSFSGTCRHCAARCAADETSV